MAAKESNLHPLVLLYFVRGFWAVSYSIFYGSLSIFFTDKLGYSFTSAAMITSLFISIGYVLPLFGGVLIQKYISNLRLYVISNLFQAAGLLTIVISPESFILQGLSLFLIGTLTNVTSVNILIQSLYSSKDRDRERSFLWSYSAINIGFVGGYIVSGIFHITNFSSLCLVSIVMLFISLVLFCLVARRPEFSLVEHVVERKIKNYFTPAILAILVILIYLSLVLPVIGISIILTVSVVFLAWLALTAFKEDNKNLSIFLWLLVLACIYWGAYLLTPAILFNYAQKFVELRFRSYSLSPEWLGATNSLMLLVGCPLFAIFYKELKKIWIIKTTPRAFLTAIFLLGLGFISLYLGPKFTTSGKVPIWSPAIYVIMQSLSELLIAPLLYSIVKEYVPSNRVLLMTGFAALPMAIGSLLSSEVLSLENLKINTSANNILPEFSNIFLMISIVLVGTCFMVAIFKVMKTLASRCKPNKTIIGSDSLAPDYICWVLFSVISGFYLVLPVYFYDVYSYSHTKATTIVTLYLVGRTAGMFTYLRLVKWMVSKLRNQRISVERLFLIISGISVSALMLTFNFTGDYRYIASCLFFVGVFSSAFTTLTTAIMNGRAHDKDKVKHSSLQRWFQNAGIIITFLLFSFWKYVHFNIFLVFSGILLVASLLEALLISHRVGVVSNINKKSNSQEGADTALRTRFFMVALLAFVIFMQIPNAYAYYLHDYFGINSSLFSRLMVLNAVLVLVFQMAISKHVISKIDRRLSAAIGLILIGLGLALPIIYWKFIPVLSFVAWTAGEIFMFTAIKSYMIAFSNSDPKNNVTLTTRYYTIFYLSSLACPFVVRYLYYGLSGQAVLFVFSIASVIVAGLWMRYC